MGYPAGSVYRLLLLTGLRLNEAAQLSWPEVQGSAIVIPASRMKGKEGKAREHLVPLSSAAQEVIASLPRIKNGPFLFSMSAGKRPLAMTGPIKSDLDRRMLRRLKALARRRGEDHEHVTLPEWVNHDLRRVVRSGLSLFASNTTSRKQFLHIGHPVSSAPTTCMSMRMRRPRRWRHGRSGSRPSSTRSLPRPPRSSSCGGGGGD
jgi:integrase